MLLIKIKFLTSKIKPHLETSCNVRIFKIKISLALEFIFIVYIKNTIKRDHHKVSVFKIDYFLYLDNPFLCELKGRKRMHIELRENLTKVSEDLKQRMV